MNKQATLRIPAIHCGACAGAITRQVQALAGASVTDVDTEAKLVHLRFDDSRVSLDQIREALDQIGFSPED